MMKMTKKDRIARLEDFLVKSHRTRPDIETGAEWNMHVMAKVTREERVQSGRRDADAAAQGIVWRFAAVVCVLALVFSIYTFRKGIGREQIEAELFINDPLYLTTVQIF
jgi:hypothetical protein